MNTHATMVPTLSLAPAAGVLLSTLAALMGAPAPAAAQDIPDAVKDTAYTPGDYRVYTGAGEVSTLDDLVAAMADADVVFIGETHDDPTGHMLETELLRRADQTYGDVALSLEFFERDVQLVLDEYLTGLITESSFTASARPWPRYATDYRPLIEYAKAHGIDVIAANAPRRYVHRVTREGRQALDSLPASARAYLAPLPYGEPSPEYRDQWIGVISEVMEQEGTKCGLPVADSMARAPMGSHGAMGNQLQAQALWDATMAWSIAEYLDMHPEDRVLHMVGGFHVARGTGTPEQFAAYRPEARSMIVMLRPADDIDTFEPAPSGPWGDFVIQTDASRTLEAIECRAYRAEHGAN